MNLSIDKDSTTSFQILHFNDVYELEKSPAFAQQFMEHNTPHTLRLFSGDLLNPSLVSIFEKGKQFIPLFQKLQPQYSAIGNHDLDFGEDHFISIADKFSTKWMMANLKRRVDDVNIGNSIEFDFYYIGTLKIGIFALLDQYWINASTIKQDQYIYEDYLEKARYISRLLKSFGCVFVIALTHMATISDELLLADPENKIDLILGGHDHMYLVKRQGNRVLIKSGSNFDFFTKINVSFFSKKSFFSRSQIVPQLPASDSNNFSETNNFSYVLDSSNKSQFKTGSFLIENSNAYLKIDYERFEITDKTHHDPEIQTHLDNVLREIANRNKAPILKLESEFNITFSHLRTTESKIGMLVADLTRIKTRTDIVMIHGGHLRSEAIYPAGSIFRMMDLFKLLPILDFQVSHIAKGADLKDFLEQGYQFLPNASGGYPNFSGVELTLNPSKPSMSRIDESTIMITGKPFSRDQAYTLSAFSFIARGKDGYTKFLDFEKISGAAEIYPMSVFQEFVSLTKNPSYRAEFELFKKVSDSHTIDSLNEAFANRNSKIYPEFSLENYSKVDSSLDELLSRLTLECIQRLQMYTLAEAIVQVGEEFVFQINREEPRSISISTDV